MFHRYRPSGPRGPSEFEPQGSHLNNRSKFHKLFSTINTINIMTYCIIICDLLVHFWQLEIRSKNYLITDLLFFRIISDKMRDFFSTLSTPMSNFMIFQGLKIPNTNFKTSLFRTCGNPLQCMFYGAIFNMNWNKESLLDFKNSKMWFYKRTKNEVPKSNNYNTKKQLV